MPFHLWLRHIAKDRIIDAHRRHHAAAKRSVDRERSFAAPTPDHSTIELVAQLCDRELTPAAAATMQELSRKFAAAIEDLDEQDREVVLMRHFEGLSNQEAAVALELSQPAASMRYLSAMRRLREMLGGPVTFVERQIPHVWAASMISIALLFPLEAWLGLDVLTLSPVLGLSSGMVFLVKAGILSGRFYIQSAALFATAGVMAMFPSVAHLIFGAVSAACFFFPGLKYYRQRKRSMESFTTVRASGMKKASQEGAAVPARRASE